MRKRNMDNDTVEGLKHVEASLNYLADKAEKPVTYMYKPPPGTPDRTGRYTPHTLPIRDGRAVLPQLSLDTHGFLLTRHESVVANFYDAKEVQAVYYPEVERLVQAVTGAAKVVVFDHNVRCTPMAQRSENGAREPVRVVHNDYTVRSGPQRVRDLLAADEAEARLKNRFAMINVWRPIRGPVQEAPLAVCDAQSLAPQDFVAMDLKYRDRTGEVYSVTFSPHHRWFYFPHMQKDEALLLKCYDSLDDGRARFSAHTAFDDPTSPPDAAARESIEARTLVFFAPEAKAKR
ncbi:MAG: methyltransferase [Deltaproteobacteria bacterium]|nr:methyltransferase [Deltaproteobacteria bacterium]